MYSIFSDSSSNLTDELIRENDLHIISLTYNAGGKEVRGYNADKPTDLKYFYELLRRRERLTTSCINTQDCIEAFTPILARGEDILYVGFSSGLSGTYAAAEQAAAELRPIYPDRRILCVDTLGASLGEGLLVLYACRMKSEGADIDTVYAWLNDNKLRLCHFFTVDDLFYLFCGGRVQKTSYLIGTVLNIKPVMHMDDEGKLVAIDRVTGRKRSLIALADLVASRIENPEEQTIAISHGDCMDAVEFLVQKLNERIKYKALIVNYVDPIVGAHSGPGTVAVFCLGGHR